jgi:hypothetical protein
LTLALAVLLGFSSAVSITGWTYPKAGMTSIINSDYFTMAYVTEGDVGYSSKYDGDLD